MTMWLCIFFSPNKIHFIWMIFDKQNTDFSRVHFVKITNNIYELNKDWGIELNSTSFSSLHSYTKKCEFTENWNKSTKIEANKRLFRMVLSTQTDLFFSLECKWCFQVAYKLTKKYCFLPILNIFVYDWKSSSLFFVVGGSDCQFYAN